MHYHHAFKSFGQVYDTDRTLRDEKSKAAMQNAIKSTQERIAGAFPDGPKVPAKKKPI